MNRESGKQWYRALACSVLLHAVLLFALLRATLPLPAVPPPATPLAIEVSLHRGNPQRLLRVEPTVAPGPALPLPEPLLPPPAAPQPPRPTLTAPAGTGTGTAESPAPAPSLDPDLLQASLATAAADWHKQQRQRGALPCQTLLQRRDPKDCEPDYSSRSQRQEQLQQSVSSLFAAANHIDREARESKELLARMAYLRPLAQQDTPLGKIAKDTYYQLEARYDQLNPGEQHGPQAGFTGPWVSDTLQLLFISPAGVSLLGGMVGIGFDGNVTVMGEAIDSPVKQQSGN